MKTKFSFKCQQNTLLAYIAGEYKDCVACVCTINGETKLYKANKIQAYMFDIKDSGKRPIDLPYDDMKKSLTDSKREFMFLQLMVCGEYAFIQHTCYSKEPFYGSSKDLFEASSGIHLYRIVPNGFVIKLVRIKTIDKETHQKHYTITAMHQVRRLGEIMPYHIDMNADRGRFQYDKENNLCSVFKMGNRSIKITTFSNADEFNETSQTILRFSPVELKSKTTRFVICSI